MILRFRTCCSYAALEENNLKIFDINPKFILFRILQVFAHNDSSLLALTVL